MSTFSWVYKSYTFKWEGVEGLWKSIFLYTFNFLAWFLLFSSKNVDVYSIWEEGISESVWFDIYVDIYGRPLQTIFNVQCLK